MTTSSTLSNAVDPARDHVRGPAGAPVTLVEYGDFECPFCGRAFPVVEEILRQRPDVVRFVYRHFPRPEHPHARHAAQAAEAAGAQGRYWEMHDQLFRHQRALDDDSLVGYARALGLNEARFRTDFTSHAFSARVQEDVQSAIHSGAHGTPTFFVNGRKHEGHAELADLLAAVDAALLATTGS